MKRGKKLSVWKHVNKLHGEAVYLRTLCMLPFFLARRLRKGHILMIVRSWQNAQNNDDLAAW